jgi:putative hydrolase of the HAD superfamily
MPSRDALVVFDLDDTLYLEREYVLSGFRVVAERFREWLGDPDRSFTLMCESLDSADRRRVFDVVVERLGLIPPSHQKDARKRIERMIACFRNHAPAIRLCPDADRALTRLADTSYLALVSDGRAETQRRKIAVLRLRGRFDRIILTDELGREFWKPHPRAFEQLAADLGLPPDRCTYIADNPAKDFVAPNQLGWTTIQIRRSGAFYLDAPAPPDGGPVRTIQSLDELT